ncbi:MAG: hypothetical protein OCD02_22240 [Spirochaetaceae bacterium]
MKRFLIVSLFIFSSIYLYAIEEISNGTTIFSYDLMDENDIYMTLEGSWKFDITTFAEGNISEAFDNIIFSMVPDLTASIWLFNKYFFEAQIKEESDENLFLLGYQNSNGILQEVRIGNDDINIEEYAGYIPPENVDRVPGTRFKIKTTNTQHEILARYSNEVKNSIEFRGLNLFEEEVLLLNNYSKYNYYILPFDDIEPLNLFILTDDELENIGSQNFIHYSETNMLYIEDVEYKTIYLDISDLNIIDAKNSLMEFVQPEDNPGILDTISEDDLWNLYTTDYEGKKYLVLSDAGSFSPFENLGCYSTEVLTITDSSDIEIYVNSSKELNFTLENSLIVFKKLEDSYNALTNRYPFMELDSDIYSLEGNGLNSENSITIEKITPVDSLTIPTEAQKDSVTIIINGSKYTDFHHDSDSGLITLEKEISPFDKIIINYNTESTLGNGNLLLSYGSRYNLNDDLTLDISHTGNWIFSTDDYSTDINENSGSMTSKAKFKYDSEIISVELNSSLNVTNHDTIGEYLLFEYDQASIDIPVDSIVLEDSADNISIQPLIKRDSDTGAYTVTEIMELDLDPLGGPYTLNHSYNESSYDVIVLETIELTSGDYSLATLGLDDYSQDYSWATEFSFDIYNNGDERTVDILFTNPSLTSSDILTKQVIVQEATGYVTYNILFSNDERSKLSYIDSIDIKIAEGSENLLLLKALNFKGDSLVTHEGSADYLVRKSDDDIKITAADPASGDNTIVISSRISTVDIDTYNFMEFTIQNNGVITDDTVISLELKNNLDVISTLTIPKTELISGENIINIEFETNTVNINDSPSMESTWDSTGDETNSFSLSFSDTGSGTVTISNIVLKEPKLTFYNENNLSFTLTPPLSVKIGSFPVIENIKFTAHNNLITDDSTTSYTGNSNIALTLLGTKLDGSIYYGDSDDNISYNLEIPYMDFPIKVFDSFSYNTNSYRSNKLKIDTSNFDSNLILSDSKGSDKGIRNSELLLELFPEQLFSISNTTKLTQIRSLELDSLENELINSYKDIIPIDDLDLSNNLIQNFDLKLDLSLIDYTLSLKNQLSQSYSPEKKDLNVYGAFTSLALTFGYLTITPSLSTSYEYLINGTDQLYISDGIEEYFKIFQSTNPYSDISFIDQFFSDEDSDFYDNEYLSNERSLNSSFNTEFKLGIKNTSFFNVLIPETVSITLNKIYLNEESQQSTDIIKTISSNFTINPIIKNTLSFTNSLNVESDDEEYETEWILLIYKEIKDKTYIDIENNLSITENDSSNITEIEFKWPGKSGPVYIVPIIDKVLDNPYYFTHIEKLYFKIDDDENFNIGIRHDTTLTVKDMNESNLYLDIGYDTESLDHLSFELGIFTTIIF